MRATRPKYVTYYRVSTQQQGRSGLGLQAQKDAVESYVRGKDGVELASFTEIESGKDNSRPQLTAALLRCRQTQSTLLVAKLDRLSRSTAFLMNLRDSGVKFQALDIPEANTLTVGVLSVLAQYERELISTRTKEALAARRARGLPLGSPRDLSKYSKRASAAARKVNHARASQRAIEIAPAISRARELGNTSLRSIATYLNELEITTPRGRQWTATAVRNAQKLLPIL